jgi:hypothetical protein
MPSKPQFFRKFVIGVALILWAMSLMLAALAQDAPASYPEFTIVANAEGITLPEGLTAGFTTLAFQNDTEAAFAPALARFREGKTMEDFMTAMAQGPAGQQAALEAVAVLGNPDAAPGEVERATYNLLAGEYLLVNFAPGGPPTILPFTVADAATDLAAEPDAQVEVTLVDYAFAMPGVLSAGDQVHHVLI